MLHISSGWAYLYCVFEHNHSETTRDEWFIALNPFFDIMTAAGSFVCSADQSRLQTVKQETQLIVAAQMESERRVHKQ